MKKLLFLDDSAMSQQLMARFLEGMCEVTSCMSLSEGRSLLASADFAKFDLVITDFLFPEGDPLEFLMELRKQYPPQQLPVIVASGSLDRRMESVVLRLGANNCLPKPLRKQEVRDLVEALLSHPTARSPDPNFALATVLGWIRGGRHYRFAPDLALQVEAESAHAANEKMQALLTETLSDPAKSAALGHAWCAEILQVEVKPL